MRQHLIAWVAVFGCTGSAPETGLSGAASGTAVAESDTSGAPASGTAANTDDGSSGESLQGVSGTTGSGVMDSSDGRASSGTSDTTVGAVTTGDSSDTQGATSTGEPFDDVIDIGITAHNDCTFTVSPASITVPLGTEFTVNWISNANSETVFDIAKIDPFNHVPIVLGLEPATSHHDEIRQWCGELFTGTFDFRLTSCFDPVYIPVDCGG